MSGLDAISESEPPASSELTRILVVDDEEPIRAVIGRYLRRLSYEVTTVGSVPEAMAALDRQIFDVLLLDVALPEISGLDLLVACRQKAPQSQVIMLTAQGSLETA